LGIVTLPRSIIFAEKRITFIGLGRTGGIGGLGVIGFGCCDEFPVLPPFIGGIGRFGCIGCGLTVVDCCEFVCLIGAGLTCPQFEHVKLPRKSTPQFRHFPLIATVVVAT
jgi:hypothetical protein